MSEEWMREHVKPPAKPKPKVEPSPSQKWMEEHVKPSTQPTPTPTPSPSQKWLKEHVAPTPTPPPSPGTVSTPSGLDIGETKAWKAYGPDPDIFVPEGLSLADQKAWLSYAAEHTDWYAEELEKYEKHLASIEKQLEWLKEQAEEEPDVAGFRFYQRDYEALYKEYERVYEKYANVYQKYEGVYKYAQRIKGKYVLGELERRKEFEKQLKARELAEVPEKKWWELPKPIEEKEGQYGLTYDEWTTEDDRTSVDRRQKFFDSEAERSRFRASLIAKDRQRILDKYEFRGSWDQFEGTVKKQEEAVGWLFGAGLAKESYGKVTLLKPLDSLTEEQKKWALQAGFKEKRYVPANKFEEVYYAAAESLKPVTDPFVAAFRPITDVLGPPLEAWDKLLESGVQPVREWSRSLEREALKAEAAKRWEGAFMFVPATTLRMGAGMLEGAKSLVSPAAWVKGASSLVKLAVRSDYREHVVIGFMRDPLALVEIPGAVFGGYFTGKLVGKLPIFHKSAKVVSRKHEVLPGDVPLVTEVYPAGVEPLKGITTLPFGLKPPVPTAEGMAYTFAYATKTPDLGRIFPSLGKAGAGGGPDISVATAVTTSGDYILIARTAYSLTLKPSVNALASGVQLAQMSTDAGQAVSALSLSTAAASGIGQAVQGAKQKVVVITCVDRNTFEDSLAKSKEIALSTVLPQLTPNMQKSMLPRVPVTTLAKTVRLVPREQMRKFGAAFADTTAGYVVDELVSSKDYSSIEKFVSTLQIDIIPRSIDRLDPRIQAKIGPKVVEQLDSDQRRKLILLLSPALIGKLNADLWLDKRTAPDVVPKLSHAQLTVILQNQKLDQETVGWLLQYMPRHWRDDFILRYPWLRRRHPRLWEPSKKGKDLKPTRFNEPYVVSFFYAMDSEERTVHARSFREAAGRAWKLKRISREPQRMRVKRLMPRR